MTVHGSYWLFYEFVHKQLGRIEDHHREAFKTMLSLFLSSTSRLRLLVDSDSNLKDAYNDELTSVVRAFRTQIGDVFVKMFGKSFGGCGREFYEFNSKSELKVWTFNSLVVFPCRIVNYVKILCRRGTS